MNIMNASQQSTIILKTRPQSELETDIPILNTGETLLIDGKVRVRVESVSIDGRVKLEVVGYKHAVEILDSEDTPEEPDNPNDYHDNSVIPFPILFRWNPRSAS